jgi:hypothetical protein
MKCFSRPVVTGATEIVTKRQKIFGSNIKKHCERSRLPHFLENQLTDGGEVVSLTYQLPFTSRKIPGSHFCWRIS